MYEIFVLVYLLAYFGRQNAKWRFGKVTDGQQQDDVIPIAVKTDTGYFVTLSAEELLNRIEVTLESQHTVLILTLQKMDKFSLIKNFLCSSKSYELFPICGRIFYYHMCTFDDDLSRDVVMFIKRLAENIFAISHEIGQEMYLNSEFDGYMSGNLCSNNLDECLNYLVIKPLQKFTKVFPQQTFLIAVNFVNECFHKPRNNSRRDILNVLRDLQNKIPSQFKYILITRHMFQISEKEMYRRYGTGFYLNTSELTLGLSNDSTRHRGKKNCHYISLNSVITSIINDL